MLKEIIIMIVALVAIVMNFTSKKIVKAIFKKEEGEEFENLNIKIKLFSFILGVIAFISALILIN